MQGTSRGLAMLVATTLLVSPALAQPTPAQKQQAGDLTKQAIAKAGAKDHDGAIELYLKAYALIPAPQLLSNIGTEYQNAQKPVEALKYFCMYLEKEPTGNVAGYAMTNARALSTELGITITDDSDVCKTPPPTVLPPVSTVVAPVLAPMASDPGKPMKITGLVGASVGLVVLGFGLYFGAQAAEHDDTISNHGMDMWPDDIEEYEADGRRYEKLQIAFDIAGGALIVAGAAVYFLGRSKTSESLAIRPLATMTSAGVALSGSF